MTRITLDLTDEDMEAVRRNLTGTVAVLRKLHAALPPVSIEPKAGGTCRRKGVPEGFPIWYIVFADEGSVVFRGLDIHGDFVVQGCAPDVFAERYEVLS